jgi:hypothetical protein
MKGSKAQITTRPICRGAGGERKYGSFIRCSAFIVSADRERNICFSFLFFSFTSVVLCLEGHVVSLNMTFHEGAAADVSAAS